jgi:hypothetical protein
MAEAIVKDKQLVWLFHLASGAKIESGVLEKFISGAYDTKPASEKTKTDPGSSAKVAATWIVRLPNRDP